jgi:two-component system, NarL family, sensor histidine kinase UhpB
MNNVPRNYICLATAISRPAAGHLPRETFTACHDHLVPSHALTHRPSQERPWTRPTLYRRLLTIYVVLVGLACAALIFAPVTVSAPVRLGEIAVILGGAVVMLVAYPALLRRTLTPLRQLTEVMRGVDPLAPGQRVSTDARDAEVAALADAFNDMLDRLEDERRESARRALGAQEDERRRIARELHDEIGQQLTGLLLRTETLARRVPADLKPDVESLREASRAAAEEVRFIARRLRPEALDELGLQSALLARCAAVESRTGIPIERHLDAGLDLTEEEEVVVYRVAQEALTNVARHSNAQRASVSLTGDADGGPLLVVRDDGDGMPEWASEDSSGIRGMRERALLVGGRLELRPAVPRGTEVRLQLPPKDEA